MRFAVRFFIFVLLFAICLGIFAASSAYLQPAFAQTPNSTRPENLHNYTQNVMIEVMSSMTCLIAGVDTINPTQKCLGVANGKIGPVDAKGGALGVVGNLIGMTFTPPFHTGVYVRYLASNFGITKHAYAQQNGIGFTSLNPLIEIWKAFRNIVYLLFVLVFILIGFAIMLRVHIDPRTVMTIENQIPKIIIGLILVTFSFAIAGLLVDLMWVLIYLSVSIFDTVNKSALGVGIDPRFSNFQGLSALQVGNNINGGIFGIASTAGQGVGGFISGFFEGPAGTLVAGAILTILGGGLGAFSGIPFGGVIGGLIGGVLGGITGNSALGLIGQVIAFLIFSLAMLFALFRLWFSLIKNYVLILMITVFSPFWIMGSIVPGSKVTFGSLLRELASRLMAFPATIIMFMLGKTFIDIFEGPGAGSTFVPPLIGNPGDYKAIGALIGLGIILLTPDVVNMVRKFTLDFGQIGGAVGVGAGAVNPLGALSRAGQLGMSWQYASQTPVLGGALRWMGRKLGRGE